MGPVVFHHVVEVSVVETELADGNLKTDGPGARPCQARELPVVT